ncbi:DHA2 family efflux MFS transporter permease subunit [Nonomuraea turcica]|uniref:DHA2 family efflux MFS transporter permease subunit n=1 Tax=Nonomuraea sp. G32 TaxID=3067274 RepID=UPI00273BFC22|nr:DHA2 family efflux MFS transporter permease subunit [Nonomuraea sp. G32]MDP4503798.1 DHA2 family efflux MFS transporter permease subunit [Nonomuraea sp. G32]
MTQTTQTSETTTSWQPLAAACLGAFMLLVDVTIVMVALPPIASDLHMSFTGAQWLLDGYALALAALLLAAGSFADHAGRRKVYLVALAVFALASLACGLAPSGGLLLAARVVQGAGGAAMMATTLALISSTYHGRQRGIAFGVWGGVNGAAAALAPVLGGLLTEHLHWRAIFLVNLPISLVAAWLTLRAVRESRLPGGGRLDWAGMVTFTVAAGALTYGLIEAGEHGWTAVRTLAPLGVAVVALVAFLVAETRSDRPMLDLRLFADRSFSGILAGAGLLMPAAFACLAFTSLWLQQDLGLGPVAAGVALSPMAVTSLVVSIGGARLFPGLSPRAAVGGGLLLIGAGAFLQGTLGPDTGWTALAPGLVVTGVGVGLAVPSLSSAAMAFAPPPRAGMAAGAVNTVRQLGYALGIAALGLLYRADAAAYVALNDVYRASAIIGLMAGLLVLAAVRATRRPDHH